MLVSDLPYVGSDFAGTFRLWPGDWRGSDPLLLDIFAHPSPDPVRPGAIKRTLDPLDIMNPGKIVNL